MKKNSINSKLVEYCSKNEKGGKICRTLIGSIWENWWRYCSGVHESKKNQT